MINKLFRPTAIFNLKKHFVLLFASIDGELQNSSSDSEFSDDYDCCLDDDLNAIVKQARINKKIKKERLSVIDPSSERMESDVQFEDWKAAIKLEADDSQQKTTENTQESNITVIENDINTEVTTNEINPGVASTNISSGNLVEHDHHINDETIIIAANQLGESGIPDETLGFFYDPEGNEWITINASQLSEFAETSLEDTTTEAALETSLMDTTSDGFRSNAEPPTTPLASDDSHWVTDYESDDVTDTNFNRNN